MIDSGRFALNRIACPALGLEDFFRLTREIGLSKVELRNDLPGGRVTDDLPPSEAAALAARHGIEVITINAVQKFNVKALAAQVAAELQAPPRRRLGSALPRRGPLPQQRPRRQARPRVAPGRDRGSPGVAGPALFRGRHSRLRRASRVRRVLPFLGGRRRRGRETLGPVLLPRALRHLSPPPRAGHGSRHRRRLRCASIHGLIHASGVEASLPVERIRDEHRVLVSPRDLTGCREQIQQHVRLGYAGDISFEPFSPEVQRLGRDELATALRKSLRYLQG